MSTTDAPLPESPLPESPWPSAPPGAPGIKMGFPGAHEKAIPAHRFSHRAMVLMLGAGLGVLTLILVVVALLATPGPAPYCNPLKCQGPPVGPRNGANGQAVHGPPVVQGTLYTNAQGFSLRYFPQPTVQTNAYGIGLTYDFRYGGTSSLFILGGSAGGSTDESVVAGYVNQNFPSAQPMFQLPDPLIGYLPAFGEAFNLQPASSDGSTQTARILVAASTYNGFAIVVAGYGNLLPTVTSKSFWFNGHPSPANLNLAYFGGTDALIDSIRFPGGG